MPPSELKRKLRSLRGHLRRLIVLTGASRIVVVLVGVLAVALFLDWSSKLATPGRLVLLGAACVVTLYATWRFLVAPLRVHLGHDQLSLLVESRFPDLRDRLISTVQFTRKPSVAPLSQAMVDQLTRDTLQQTASLDFEEVATARRPALWAVGAALTVAAACLYTMLFPAAAAIFASRFFDPFSSVEWPRRTQLRVIALDKDSHQLAIEGDRIFVPKGEDLNLLVRAAKHSGKLWQPPSRVTVRYRFDAGGKGRRSVPMGDPAAYRTCFAAVIEGFAFYVTGDDATTATYTVATRNRPRIEDIRIAIRAPGYVHEGERVQADGRGSIVGLAGSTVTLHATTNKPIADAPDSALLRIDAQPSIPLDFVDGDPTRLHGSFQLRVGQERYAIELLDTEGLTNAPPVTYRLDVRPDRAPAVKLAEPGRSTKVTAKALVPIRIEAEDDNAVRRLRFLFQRDPKAQPVVHTFPDPPEDEKSAAAAYDWDLAALALKEGGVLSLYGEAEDAYTETRDGEQLGPNVGKSPTYTLTVISEAEMASLLQRRQQELKERLKKLITRQEDNKADVERLGHPDAEKIDRRTVSLTEREQRKIGASTADIASELGKVLQDMRNNKVGNLAEQRRAEDLSKTLGKLADDDMPDAARRIASAGQAPELPQQRSQLASAAGKQQEILDDLRGALARFDQWHHIDELLRDASELLMAQKKVNERTADLGRKLLGKPADQLTPAEKGAAGSLARSQQTARNSMAALETKMAEVARTLAEPDPAAAKLVEQALSQAAADQIRRRMDDAANHIQQGKPASARPPQADATAGLERLVETLSRARSPYLARDLQRLQEQVRRQLEELNRLLKDERRQLSETSVANLRRQLGKLRKEQAGTKNATEQAATPDALKQQAPDQAGHAQQAESLAQQAESLAQAAESQASKEPLDQAGKALQNASQQMTQATKSLADTQKPEATGSQEKALEQLDEADRHLAQLQKQLAKEKAERERLAQRAQEQAQTAQDTRNAAQSIQKTAQDAEKIVPDTAQSIQQAGQSTSQASNSMSQAQQQLGQASQQADSGPSQQSQAQQDQQDAVNELEDARQQLARAHDELDLRRRQQELFEIEKALTAMLPRQVAIREETQKTDAATEGSTKPLTHAQTLTVASLADKQGTIREEANGIVERLKKGNVPVFHYVMSDTAREMGEVQKLLGQREVGWNTQDSEREIERNLMQLIDALKDEAARLAEQQGPPPGGGGGGGGRPAPLVPPLAQLKQLRTMQLDVLTNTRTVEVDRRTRSDRRQRLLKSRAARLARKQADLTKITNEFADELERQTQERMDAPNRPQGDQDQ